MGWGSVVARSSVFLLFLSVVLVPTTTAWAQSTQEQDERIVVVSVSPEAPYERTVSLEAGDQALLSWVCEACSVEVDGEGVAGDIVASNTMRITASNPTEATISISTSEDESVSTMLIASTDEAYPTVRPAPGEIAAPTPVGTCNPIETCIDAETGTLASRIPPSLDEDFLLSGYLQSTNDEYIVIDVDSGDTLEWQWLATTHETTVRMYHQSNSSERTLDTVHAVPAGFTELGGEPPKSAWWTAEEDGRFIARISSSEPGALWAAHAMVHPVASDLNLVEMNLRYGVEVVGHHTREALFAWSDVEALHLHTRLANATIQVDQLMDGNWVKGPEVALEAGESLTLHPYPNTTVGRLKVINTTVFSLELLAVSFADQNELEAPAYRPTTAEVDNSSWPVLNLTNTSSGEFTLAVHDTADTYRLEVDGWLDSIHFVQFTLSGNVEGLEVQLWDIDQTTGDVLATDITRPVGDVLSIGLQVGRGTHYIQFRFQNASLVTPHLWGEDVAARAYTVQGAYSLIDEGEEPWYPPSEDAVFWGGVARWFLGLLFLLPVLYLAVWLRKNQRFAQELAEKKQRLAWYSARLDSGETSVKEAQSDLSNVLEAVAQLAWQDGLEAWGQDRLEHRTESVAMAVWQVDPRLARNEGNWVLVVGVHILSDAWELAALRFDAPEGQAFSVSHVEPRFLHQGEELFLDQLHEGHRAYVVVELEGPEPRVDVELNGRVGGQPFAARMPETVQRAESTS